MLENYLGYLEICTQLEINQNGTKETFELINKYTTLLDDEWRNLSQPDREKLIEIVEIKIKNAKIEKSAIMLAQTIIVKDQQLKKCFPGHIKAQYSDKMKKTNKEIQYLEYTLIYLKGSKTTAKPLR